jgi:hypothetical protein
MEFLTQILPNFFEVFKIAFYFVTRGGWVLFVIGLIYMLWRLYKVEIMIQHLKKQKWVFFQIKVPKDNLASTMGVDNVFSQLHSLHVAKTFYEKFVEGQFFQLWYSFELISLGGKVSFIIRLPERMRHNVEAAIYSQYPTAEIAEVADYMENLHYNPYDPGDLDIFGTEWKMDQDQVIPIKTYKDFEHPAAEEKILDPLSHIFESLAKIEPHEFFGIQILAMPLADEEWKPKAELKIKELTGQEIPHKLKFSDIFLAPFNWFAKFSYKEAILSKPHRPEPENRPRSNWLNMTEGEKQRVTLIENKINKPGYKTKIRFLYIAPKDKFDKSKVFMVVGAYRPFTAPFYNKIKPDVHRTWTHVDAYFSPSLEKPVIDWKLKWKKRFMFKGYKRRDWDIGIPMFILNTEELATLYHFPITTETTSVIAAVERTESKKAQAPANLPIAED